MPSMKPPLIAAALGLLGTALCLLSGCIKSLVNDQQVSKNLGYFQDKRTHLCFAYWKDAGGCITQVPCINVQAGLDNDWAR